MHIEDSEISNKSQILTLFLCLVFGKLGVHRFYVGKYITGIIFLVIGGTSIVLDLLGFGYAFIVSIIYLIIMVLDVYALYSDSFTDKKGKLVIGNEKTLVYKDLQERETKLFVNKLDKILCIIFGVIAYLVYFIIVKII